MDTRGVPPAQTSSRRRHRPRSRSAPHQCCSVLSARAAPREAGVVVTLRETAEAAAQLAQCSRRRSASRSSDHQRAPIDARRGCLLCSRGRLSTLAEGVFSARRVAPGGDLAAWPRLADMASDNRPGDHCGPATHCSPLDRKARSCRLAVSGRYCPSAASGRSHHSEASDRSRPPSPPDRLWHTVR